jgi:hypothetical protein
MRACLPCVCHHLHISSMSRVHIPAPGPGNLQCELQLHSKDDQQRFVDRLRAAVDLLIRQR